MKPNEHIKRQNYRKYDRERYMLYLSEQQVEIEVDPYETDDRAEHSPAAKIAGYSYAGDLPDGGILIPASNVTAENMRDKFISGLIRRRYTQDEVEAIILNGEDSEEHAAQFAQLQAYRSECKEQIRELLNR